MSEHRPTGPVDMLFLSQEDVVSAGGLDMDACMDAIEQALVLHHRGETIAPAKATIHWSDELEGDEREGRIMAMPAYVGGEVHTAGVKWIPSVPSNRERGLPRGIGLIVLSDPDTGLPVAVMDGTVVSAMRTGAVSGLAARCLARDGAGVLTLLGAGVQGRTQLMALERALPFVEQTRIFDIDTERAVRLAEERTTQGASAQVVDDAEKAVRDADVVIAATMAPEPFVAPTWLEPGSLFVSVSSLDITVDALAAVDLIVTDDITHETAHPSRPLARLAAAGLLRAEEVVSLGAVLAGDHPGRTSDDQRVVVSPVGMGIEDVAEAARVLRGAVRSRIGTSQRLWERPLWT